MDRNRITLTVSAKKTSIHKSNAKKHLAKLKTEFLITFRRQVVTYSLIGSSHLKVLSKILQTTSWYGRHAIGLVASRTPIRMSIS